MTIFEFLEDFDNEELYENDPPMWQDIMVEQVEQWNQDHDTSLIPSREIERYLYNKRRKQYEE